MKAEKSLPQPEVVFIEDFEHGGEYWRPETDCLLRICDLEIPMDRGIIGIDTDTSCIPDIIAHEFRHHWQLFTRDLTAQIPAIWTHDPDDLDEDSYRYEIVQFFTRDFHEIDALNFAASKYPCDVTILWLDWIQQHKQHEKEMTNAK